jgi:hypothetical protein
MDDDDDGTALGELAAKVREIDRVQWVLVLQGLMIGVLLHLHGRHLRDHERRLAGVETTAGKLAGQVAFLRDVARSHDDQIERSEPA